MTDEDDGYGALEPAEGVIAGTDCDDDEEEINPAATELGDDDIDQDCMVRMR